METSKAHLIAVKVHGNGVVGACDATLVGKRIKHGKLTIELSKEFYFEKHATQEELAELLEECETANLVGEKAVNTYCEKNPEAHASVIKIGNVPHLQVFRL